MSTLASVVTGRRTKWVVLVLWILVLLVMQPLGAKLADETTDDTESFLPDSAESTEVVRILDDDFGGGETTQGQIVYRRTGGLTAEDKQRIIDDAENVATAGIDEIPLTEPPSQPFTISGQTNAAQVSKDGDVAFTVLTVPVSGDFETQAEWGQNVRDIIERDQPEGTTVLLTGDLGFAVDAHDVFSSLDAKLLLATVLLVLVLLGLIYRAVLVALAPLLVVFFAYTVASGFIYLLAKSGETVSSNSTSILVVLMFGVGTDYCLLLVSRYREELRVTRDKHDAMAHALTRAGPAILASGLTVTLAMLVLRLADAGNTSSLGPTAALGVFCAMVAGLTLLPALLTIFGRRGFWPRRSVVEYDPNHKPDERVGAWRRFGDKVLQAARDGTDHHRVGLRRRRPGDPGLQGRLLDDHLLQEQGRRRGGLQGPG